MDFFDNDFLDNPTQRVPVCICLDTSGSMSGNPIRELNEGIKVFFDSIMEDEIASYSADVCVITFGQSPKCIMDFTTVSNVRNIPILTAHGGTPMGDAINLALDKLEKRKNDYKNAGIDYFQPWLVIMTDGEPCGDSTPNALEKAQARATQLANNRKLVVMPIWIGDNDEESGMKVLSGFSPKNQPKKLKGLNFQAFFTWLSSSVSGVSQSNNKSFTLKPTTEWSVQ